MAKWRIEIDESAYYDILLALSTAAHDMQQHMSECIKLGLMESSEYYRSMMRGFLDAERKVLEGSLLIADKHAYQPQGAKCHE